PQRKALKFGAEKEAGSSQDPIIWVANQEDLTGISNRDSRRVVEHEVTPAEEVPVVGKSPDMITQDLVLNKLGIVLLLDGDEHADDVPHQVAAALRRTIQKERLLKLRLNEFEILLIQRVRLQIDL